MDILVRNIEIPKDCTECFCYKDAGYCGITKTEVDLMEEYGTLNNDCPLNAHIEPQIPFSVLRRACKHKRLSRDFYGGEDELHDTCHYDMFSEHGWDDCAEINCPMLHER